VGPPDLAPEADVGEKGAGADDVGEGGADVGEGGFDQVEDVTDCS